MKDIEYIYSFANASLTIRVIEYLRDKYQATLNSVTVINLIDGWLVKISLINSIKQEAHQNLTAFLQEMGFPYQPSALIGTALARLEAGDSLTEIMNRYQVVIVAYGKPEKKEIEVFRNQIVKRLGYCPQNMA
ncbi:MAG: hypothetical protein D6756_01455 [Cyanobacteria bacterium J083]|nr:MAG: hypothetical protein D6756_01455 [Cyanobacteria bacterium J083]